MSKRIITSIITIIMVLSICFVCLTACNEKIDLTKGSIIIVDSDGYTVGFDATPTRVVVFQAALADVWIQSGGTIVGITDDYDDYGLNIENVEIIGENHYTQDELIVNLKPDFVIYSRKNTKDLAVVEKLKSMNIKTFGAEIENFADYLYVLSQFCKLTGRDDIYKSNGVDIQTKINTIISSVPEEHNNSYILLRTRSTSNPTIIGSNHFVSEMLDDLGATNIAASNEDTGNLTFSMEKVVEANPDYIFITFMGISNVVKSKTWLANNILNKPEWQNLDAVKNNKVIYLYDENNLDRAHLFQYKPNEKWADAYQYLYDQLY